MVSMPFNGLISTIQWYYAEKEQVLGVNALQRTFFFSTYRYDSDVFQEQGDVNTLQRAFFISTTI